MRLVIAVFTLAALLPFGAFYAMLLGLPWWSFPVAVAVVMCARWAYRHYRTSPPPGFAPVVISDETYPPSRDDIVDLDS
jgi:hypothetical protein